jgi:hypothetical protein
MSEVFYKNHKVTIKGSKAPSKGWDADEVIIGSTTGLTKIYERELSELRFFETQKNAEEHGLGFAKAWIDRQS